MEVRLDFTTENKYRMVFTPSEYWKPFADSYHALPWGSSEEGLTIVAETYSYLLDILVQARLYHIYTKGERP
ncbi:MAG: hypothetical protein GKC10_09145 [Methanosarcinales archaeon]|nr:hypothetical protein [Methanosarcinales archaeon]